MNGKSWTWECFEKKVKTLGSKKLQPLGEATREIKRESLSERPGVFEDFKIGFVDNRGD